MPAIALTDHGNIFGIPSFLDEAKKNGIRGIVGCEIYGLWDLAMDSRPPRERNELYHMCLLAKDLKGYSNLVHMISQAHTRGFYYKPRVDLETLAQFSDGLIATSGCLQGRIANCLLHGDGDGADEAIGRYIDIFGRENFFLEVQNHGIDKQLQILADQFRLADRHGVAAIATNDVHYIYREDWEAHDALLCIQTAAKLSDENRMTMKDHRQFYLKSYEEMALLFGERPDCLKNTCHVAEMCAFEMPYGKNHYPVFPMAEELSSISKDEYLKTLCVRGIEERYGIDYGSPEASGGEPHQGVTAIAIVERVEHELRVIGKAGFVDYFLVVQDFVRWALNHGISVGPGRGSGAGSIVAYALHITDIDPMRFGLIFERFLNPERISPPDFDIDFCMRRRDEVIEYVREKYGRGGVANIITFGTFGAKMAMRDLLRVNDVPYAEANRIAKMIPDELGIDLAGAVSRSPELQNEMRHNFLLKKTIEQGKVIEGTVRNTGTHACGMVISDESIENHIPVTLQDGNLTTQYSKDYVEQLGLLKMDFLGLKTLTVIADTVKFIGKKDSNFSIQSIALDDPATFALINSGNTAGVFQLESDGMRALCRQFEVANIEEISDLSALYRPGPMDWIPEYVRGKRNPSDVHYAHPILQSVCQKTYGVLIYQEQVMEAARVIAGYSMGEADILRRAMGKKKVEVMNAQRTTFVTGAKKNGIDEKKANEIFDILAKFAGYGFNKSHSISYAIIAYQTAYLKSHYPLEFFASILSSELNNPDKMSFFIAEAKANGIAVLGPDINESSEYFTPIDGADGQVGRIRFGLAAIRGMGESSTETILQERSTSGKYRSFADFAWRAEGKVVNRRIFENLVLSGSFDGFSVDRQHLFNSLDRIIKARSKAKSQENSLQNDFFQTLEKEDYNPLESFIEIHGEPMSMANKLRHEKELLGFYVSGHPLDVLCGLERHIDTLSAERPMARDQQPFTLVGCIGDIAKKFTKKTNRIWAHVQLNGRQGDYVINFFPDAYEEYLPLLTVGAIIVVKGTIRIQEERQSLNVTGAYDCENFLQKFSRLLRITLSHGDGNVLREFLGAFAEYAANNPGNVPVEMAIECGEIFRSLQPDIPLRIAINFEQFHQLTEMEGFQTVCIALASQR
jgi:DNA polymerase-3 subunit alpha